jgi:hypothetical protein
MLTRCAESRPRGVEWIEVTWIRQATARHGRAPEENRSIAGVARGRTDVTPMRPRRDAKIATSEITVG